MPLLAHSALLCWILHGITIIDTVFASPLSTGHAIHEDPVAEPVLLYSRDSIATASGLTHLVDSSVSTDSFNLPSPLGRSLQTFSDPSVDPKISARNQVAYHSNLHLRSSTRNITAVYGDVLYAAPILSSELSALLLAIHKDLSAHGQNEETNLYQFNHTNWSFEVAIGNGTLYYSSIASIVTRFLHLTSSQPSNDISWTRVGCLYSEAIAIADVAIIPSSTDQESSFANVNPADNASVPATPVKIITVSPTGVTNTTGLINPNALDFYKAALATLFSKRQVSSFEREIILKVFNKSLWLSLHILRDPGERMTACALVIFIISVIGLAICKLSLGLLAEVLLGLWSSDRLGGLLEYNRIDSGSYRVGRLAARFIMRTTARDDQGDLLTFSVATWRDLANTILKPLRRLGTGEEVYSMGGEIRGPNPEDGSGKVETLGEWQMVVEPAPEIVHDKL